MVICSSCDYNIVQQLVGFPVRMLCINWIILYFRWNLGIILVYKNRFNFNFNFLFNFFMKIIATSKFAVLISLAGMFSSKPEQNSFMFPSITATRSTTWPHSISQSKWTHSCFKWIEYEMWLLEDMEFLLKCVTWYHKRKKFYIHKQPCIIYCLLYKHHKP